MISVQGLVTLAGDVSISLGSLPTEDQDFAIMANTGSQASNSTVLENFFNGQPITRTGASSVTNGGALNGGNDLFLSVVAVPEPGTLASLVLGSLGVILWSRRLRRKYTAGR
jgi:hypothetical protein